MKRSTITLIIFAGASFLSVIAAVVIVAV